MWLECRFLDTEFDDSSPNISMVSHRARHFIIEHIGHVVRMSVSGYRV